MKNPPICRFILSLTILVFSSISFQTFAQEIDRHGYIITINNDTLFGLIKIKSNVNNCAECIFWEDSATNKNQKTYLPFEIKSFTIGDWKYYISKEIEINGTIRKVFIEYLVNGIVDLFCYKTNEKNYYYLEKENKLIELSSDEKEIIVENKSYIQKHDKYKGVLLYIFQDSPALKNDIQTSTLNTKSLIKITKKYHNTVCKDYACIEYSKSPGGAIWIEPSVSFVNSWLGFNFSNDRSFTFSPAFGLNFRHNQSHQNNVWSFLTGFHISKYNFNGDFLDQTFAQGERSYNTKLEYTLLDIPVIIEYIFPLDNFKPFISLAYHNCFILNSDHENKVSTKYVNSSLEEPWAIVDPYSDSGLYQFGLSAGVGMTYLLTEKSNLIMKLNFIYRDQVQNTNKILDQQNTFGIQFSFAYSHKIN